MNYFKKTGLNLLFVDPSLSNNYAILKENLYDIERENDANNNSQEFLRKNKGGLSFQEPGNESGQFMQSLWNVYNKGVGGGAPIFYDRNLNSEPVGVLVDSSSSDSQQSKKMRDFYNFSPGVPHAVGLGEKSGAYSVIYNNNDNFNNLRLKSKNMQYQTLKMKSRVGIDQWSSMVSIIQFFVLVFFVSFTIIFYNEYSSMKNIPAFKKDKLHVVSDKWILASGRCDQWVDGSCLPLPYDLGKLDKYNLGGVLSEFEVFDTGLFSSVNAIFFCFSAVVISTSFSLVSVISLQESTSKMLNYSSKLILVIFSLLVLFLKDKWDIPLNNLIVVEFFAFVAFFTITLKSKIDWSDKTSISKRNTLCVASNSLTYPLIIISVLSTLGENNSLFLSVVFISTFIAWVLMAIAYNEVSIENSVNNRSSMILLLSYWCCLIPFIIACSLRIYFVLLNNNDQSASSFVQLQFPAWSMALLGLMFGTYLMDSIWFTFHYSYYYDENPEVSFISMIIRVVDFLSKNTVYILLIVGYYIELSNI